MCSKISNFAKKIQKNCKILRNFGAKSRFVAIIHSCYSWNFNPILKNSVHNSNQNHAPKYGKCRSSDGFYPRNYTIRNVESLKQCADECGNSRETPNTCQGFDYNTNTNTCTFYGNDRSKYESPGTKEDSVVLTGNRIAVDGRKSVCYINNKFTPVNTEILNN